MTNILPVSLIEGNSIALCKPPGRVFSDEICGSCLDLDILATDSRAKFAMHLPIRAAPTLPATY